jgi:hypothetical protein
MEIFPSREREKARASAETALASEDLVSSLKNLYESQSGDVSILARGKTILVHSIIIRNNSPVFNAMFNSWTQESKGKEIAMEDFSPESIDQLFRYIYYRHHTDSSDLNIIFELFRLTDKYAIDKYNDYLNDILIRNISGKSIIPIMNFADSYETNTYTLLEKCVDFIVTDIKSRLDNVCYDTGAHTNRYCCFHIYKSGDSGLPGYCTYWYRQGREIPQHIDTSMCCLHRGTIQAEFSPQNVIDFPPDVKDRILIRLLIG